MSRTNRYDLLIKVAEVNQEDAGRTLADDQAALQESQGKLQELLLYRTDYANDISKGSDVGYGVQFQNHCLFLNRLNRAITAQRQQLDQRGSTLEASRRRWQDAHKQTAILNKVAERTRTADRAAADKRDQKWLDELAGAAHARSSKRN